MYLIWKKYVFYEHVLVSFIDILYGFAYNIKPMVINYEFHSIIIIIDMNSVINYF